MRAPGNQGASAVPPEVVNETPSLDAGAGPWTEWCKGQLALYEKAADADPLTNPVWRLAYDLFQAAVSGRAEHAALAGAAKLMSDNALFARASAIAVAHGEGSPNAALIGEVLAPLTGRSFEDARREIERTRAGVVFTAHPTFALSKAMRSAIGAYASARNPAERNAAAKTMHGLPHAPDDQITLGAEHEAAGEAISRAQEAMREAAREILGWARSRYPDRWTELSPAPLSLATWVGYDIDGRTDIHWGETFRIRLEEKSRQLARYAGALKAIDLSGSSEKRDALVRRLSGASAFAKEQADRFSGDLDDPEVITKAANTLTMEEPRRLVSLQTTIDELGALIAAAKNDDAKLALCVLRAEMKNYGLGVARIHLRVNAAQVRSALRADLGVEHGREFNDRTTLTLAAERAGAARERRINVASIFLERMTARRQFMLCAEFLKHIDAETPIRFLIAECEAPATVMGAIYLARLYGVEDKIDISPLFETPEAIERGGRFMERLLALKEYVEYIRARRRLAIQIGFSDSGRFMGQAPANLGIERLQILLARALAHEEIRDVEVVIFNTHGESMGRGGYPGSLQERFDFLMTPWTRSRYARERLAANAECSFQGGDGFLHFETKSLARSTIASLMRWSFHQPTADLGDRYYSDINYSWDFYRGVKNWQELLFDNADYHVAIGAFASNLLFTTGSRKVQRQSGATTTGPRALRAIPHNAILQQLAAPANVFGGVGQVAGAEPERLVDHVHGSARMKEIAGIVRRARSVTSLAVIRGYATLFDATFWVSKASAETDLAKAGACRELAGRLNDQKVPTAMHRLANLFAADLAKLDRALSEVDGADGAAGRNEKRREMHALHAIRQAMIMRAFVLAASLPSFSSRHDVSRSTVFELAFQLKFDELADLLDEIFPAVNTSAAALAGVKEESDDAADGVRGYPEIQETIVRPLRRIHRTIREIGVGLSHYYGAWG